MGPHWRNTRGTRPLAVYALVPRKGIEPPLPCGKRIQGLSSNVRQRPQTFVP